ncbi:hypothetical protein B4P00_01765 [Shewanella xiamenensis]|nr:hypothetical protein [Shewanella xiamenensis]ODR86267.1 hypothetical protein ABT47_13600 [Shewanella xiamenensis]BDQ67172.1 hypothetical protein NUITMVS2_29840 [Shewanella xiamenensis]GLD75792.1 hypothetical protein NUITMVS3_02230 [Shewanella xiamenensis]
MPQRQRIDFVTNEMGVFNLELIFVKKCGSLIFVVCEFGHICVHRYGINIKLPPIGIKVAIGPKSVGEKFYL